MKRNLLLSLFSIITIGFISLSCNPTSSHSEASYLETKMTLEEKEKLSPTAFLTTNGTYRRNLLGKWVVEGAIKNTATLATYKDVMIAVHFYSKTQTLLQTQRHPIYEYFPSGEIKNFTIRTFGPKGAETVSYEIESASNVE